LNTFLTGLSMNRYKSKIIKLDLQKCYRHNVNCKTTKCNLHSHFNNPVTLKLQCSPNAFLYSHYELHMHQQTIALTIPWALYLLTVQLTRT
jgi:hypothetical protein